VISKCQFNITSISAWLDFVVLWYLGAEQRLENVLLANATVVFLFAVFKVVVFVIFVVVIFAVVFVVFGEGDVGFSFDLCCFALLLLVDSKALNVVKNDVLHGIVDRKVWQRELELDRFFDRLNEWCPNEEHQTLLPDISELSLFHFVITLSFCRS